MQKLLIICAIAMCAVGCSNKTSIDGDIARESEKKLSEAYRQVGSPLIKNFQEMRLAKQIYEKRDNVNLVTHTYIVDYLGKFHYFGQSIGYGLPYSTQFSNPQKLEYSMPELAANYSKTPMPQAEPNGLFMPVTSSATWIMMKTPNGIDPQYVEPSICVFTFKLPDDHPQVANNTPLYQYNSAER